MRDLSIKIERVIAQHFVAPPRPLNDYSEAVQGKHNESEVSGWLVGVFDDEIYGWWGPVTKNIAVLVEDLFQAVELTKPVSPPEWAHRLEHSTRHAHTGLLKIAIGAFELACWDLLGKQTDTPVWALLGGEVRLEVPTYATCFGISPEDLESISVAQTVKNHWEIQKWRPVRKVAQLNALAAAAGGDGRLALDFGGTWSIDSILGLCGDLDYKLAWIEEPFPPSKMHLSRLGLLPAPHAGGEHCYGPPETTILEVAGVEIWQPDAVFCGGFGSLIEIAKRANIVGARCIPHGGGFIPAVHAAIGCSFIECAEFHLLLEPKRQAHLEQPVLPKLGMNVIQPDRPGWAGPLHPDLKMKNV